jgi:hypothetical protein
VLDDPCPPHFASPGAVGCGEGPCDCLAFVLKSSLYYKHESGECESIKRRAHKKKKTAARDLKRYRGVIVGSDILRLALLSGELSHSV